MITRRKLLKLTLASLVVPAVRPVKARGAVSSSPGPRALTARAVFSGPARPCPTFVLDGALADIPQRPWTQQPGLLAGVSAAGPNALGYPGKPLADYWDWQSGWVDTAHLQGSIAQLPEHIIRMMQGSGCVNLDELRAACAATGAPVLFTANMLSRSPRLTSPGSADPIADAAAGKTYLLDGLRACAARGIHPRWLALGDSLAGEQSWPRSPASIVFRGDYSSGTTEYPQVAVDWTAAARQYNPKLAVAAYAVSGTETSDPRVAQWNARLSQALAGQVNASALAFSLAIPGGMGVSSTAASGWMDQTAQRQQYSRFKDAQKPETGQALRALFALPAARLRSWLDQPLADGRALRASGLRFWWNGVHVADPVGALRYTWAHGLLLASALHAALREPLIDLAVLRNTADVFHSAFFSDLKIFGQLMLDTADGVDRLQLVNSVLPGARSAAGHVYALFFAAARDAATAQPLAFDGLDSTLVWGWAFAAQSARPGRVLLANLTETGVDLDLTALWAAVGGVLEGQIFQAAPGTFITRASGQPGVPFALTVTTADTARERPLRLPPYSLALLAGRRLENPVYLPAIQKYN